ncbi:hypothetical protein CcI49_24190 [Frankia sp. CcI49]|uniref:hypothetical protein n=1 Tax=Frankiaceae TaxID=74712 RepID=UPI0001C46716|nr:MULTISPECIES: hypothetical protein [Frankiaceae]EFC83546.1 hypothetical protein FrEUN1fDRAFT_3342 [Parafrankia sp. EUN1f]KPM50446.1 hypothetical protein ACG83_39670 [Frankia sp. R43]ONH58023.1 hypothetical protein CcI49_24190 [Frankia sp. CcI49]
MVPTLAGRLQTRLFLLATVGVVLTVLVTPLLPVDAPLGTAYRASFGVLFAVALLGLGWELAYHGLQQFRWEKDWPTMFGLLTALNEGLLVWLAVRADAVPGAAGLAGSAFVIHFGVVWVGVWLCANGPMRVPFLRWRFHGGRLL